MKVMDIYSSLIKAPLEAHKHHKAHIPHDKNLAKSNISLFVEDITVSFDGFKALNNLTFYLKEGELRCFIGPNGAGKTTMMDILTGKTRPDAGSAFFIPHFEKQESKLIVDLLQQDEVEIANLGISRKFQKPSVFETLTVAQNLELSLKQNKGVFALLKAKLNSEDLDFLVAVAKKIKLEDKLNMISGLLSHGQKQWLEIGMLLMQKPSVIMLDEPVAGMSAVEIDMTIELLNELRGHKTIMVIEHDMEFVKAIADKVTVLCQGSVLAEGSMSDIQNNEEVQKAYLGTGFKE